MTVDGNMELGTLVTQRPKASSVLRRHGLDFCLRGGTSLSAACEQAGVDVAQIIEEIEPIAEAADDARWDRRSLQELITHILDVYHAPFDDDLGQIVRLADEVLRVHGDEEPERSRQLHAAVHSLSDDLIPHMQKEEHVLFPWIASGQEPAPEGPIQMMQMEHEGAGQLLDTVRKLTNRFEPPEGAGTDLRDLYARLDRFDAELRDHIHLESNVLFPRVLGQ